MNQRNEACVEQANVDWEVSDVDRNRILEAVNDKQQLFDDDVLEPLDLLAIHCKFENNRAMELMSALASLEDDNSVEQLIEKNIKTMLRLQSKR